MILKQPNGLIVKKNITIEETQILKNINTLKFNKNRQIFL